MTVFPPVAKCPLLLPDDPIPFGGKIATLEKWERETGPACNCNMMPRGPSWLPVLTRFGVQIDIGWGRKKKKIGCRPSNHRCLPTKKNLHKLGWQVNDNDSSGGNSWRPQQFRQRPQNKIPVPARSAWEKPPCILAEEVEKNGVSQNEGGGGEESGPEASNLV